MEEVAKHLESILESIEADCQKLTEDGDLILEGALDADLVHGELVKLRNLMFDNGVRLP